MTPETGVPELDERVVEQAPVEEPVALESGDPREQRDPQVTRETVDVLEPAPARRTVPKEALDEERRKRKDAQQLYRNAEARRQELEAQAARQSAARRQQQRQTTERVDWNTFKDTNEFVAALEKRQEAKLRDLAEAAANENLRTRALLSEKYFRRDHPDYDAVMRDSGVAERIKIHPQTGQPNDPYLHALIFSAPDPAEAAHTYGKGLLAEREEAHAEQRGYERGQSDTVQQVVRVADRPRGVANLPSSSASANTRGLTFEQIDRMSETQRRDLKRKDPALYRAYLEDA